AGRERKRRKWRVPGLERAQSLPLARYFVAISPPPLARLMMRLWYARFDAMVTMLPAPPKLTLGGSPVAGVFGIPPLSRQIPLVLLATACGEAHNLVVIPGLAFAGMRPQLLERLRALLTGREAEEAGPLQEMAKETDAVGRSASV